MAGGVIEREPPATEPEAPTLPPLAESPQSVTLGYISGLDGIRGLAVAAVLVFHGGYLSGGFLGVDLFFVLSGFLITSLLLLEVGRTHRVALGKFWIRRAKRLLPALFALVLGVTVFAWLFADPTSLDRIRGDAFSTLFYYANWHAISGGQGYWALFQSPSPLEHAWTLAIEEQFYLVWPLVVFALSWFIARRARRGHGTGEIAPKLFGICVAFAVLSPLLMAWMFDPGADPSRIYVRTDTRMGTILLGGALACWISWRGPIKSRWGRNALEVSAVVVLIGIFVAFSQVDGQMHALYRGGFFLFDFAAVVLIAACAHPQRGVVSRLLSWKPLIALGLISYGLYLWHWPVYVTLTEARTGLDGYALLAVRIAVSLAFGIASYFIVEKPIRHSNLSGRQILIAAPAVAVVCIVAVLLSTAGATQLPAAGQQFVVSGANPANSDDALGSTRAAAQAASSRTLILGDSVGVQVGRAAAAAPVADGSLVIAGAIAGCVLTDGTTGYQATTRDRTFVVPQDQLHECTTGWYETANAANATDVVLLYGSGGSFLNVGIDGQYYRPCDTQYQQWYEARLLDMADHLGEAGARINIVRLPYPTSDFLPATARSRIDCVNAVHERVVREIPGARLLDLQTLICPGGECRESIDGVPMRADGLHFVDDAAAAYVANWLLDAVGVARH